ncbi:MAG: NAD(+)/NADH kinase [Blastochloris sp.]|jgi:NAD+ kinase|nr:NAD(+)/NADH kinase [Blastochloris sp.]
MRKKIQHVTVVLNRKKVQARRLVPFIKRILDSAGIAATWVDKHPSERKLALHYGDIRTEGSQMIFSLGGDGTLLHAMRRTYGCGLPVLGINAGSLGFLTSLPADTLAEELPKIMEGHFRTSERTALAIELKRKGETVCCGWALNEAVINRGNHAHMVRVQVSISEALLGRYLCDGLIIATPTGSTAYSLSAGGPVVSPASEVFLITPICAHALGNRPMVISSDDVICVEIPKRSLGLFLQTDGLTCARLRSGDVIEIKKSPTTALLAYPQEGDFYSILRQKLGWSGTSI